jgi:hypothetical protein
VRAKVTGLAPGEPAHLSIDEVGVPDVALAEPLKVDPGKHLLVLHAGEAATAREVNAEVSVVEGRSVEVLLEVPPAPSSPQATPPPVAQPAGTPVENVPAPSDAPHRSMPMLSKVGFGVAAGGAAVGLITGFMALMSKDAISTSTGCNSNEQCVKGSPGASNLEAARTSATISTVAFSVAGVGLAAAIIGLLTDHPSSAPPPTSAWIAPWLGPGAAGIHGSF